MLGNNNIMSAMSLASHRANYQSNFFPDTVSGKPDPAIKDLNLAELRYYGKIDSFGRTIIPLVAEMVGMGQNPEQNANGQHRVLPFVKNMHDEMRENLMIKAQLGNILMNDKTFVTLEPIQAFHSPLAMYKTYIKNLLADFNLNYITDRDKSNITSFDKYVNLLFRYFSEFDEGEPVTLSGWLTSDYNSLYTTGLCFSIKQYEYHDDRTNYDFGTNPLFTYYKKLAMNKGFCLVKQAPWILIADLNSPAIKTMYPPDMKGSNDVLQTFYEYSDQYDIDLIKNYIIDYYNDFVLLNENRRSISVTCNSKTIIHNHTRTYIPMQSKYRNDYTYLKMYCHLRNMEEKKPLPPSDLNDVIRNAKKKLDMLSATGYIADTFASLLFRKPFGMNHLKQREILRTQGKKGIGITKQQAEMQAFTSDSMSGGGMSGGGSGGGY
jgi:hypothetical protein